MDGHVLKSLEHTLEEHARLHFWINEFSVVTYIRNLVLYLSHQLAYDTGGGRQGLEIWWTGDFVQCKRAIDKS